MALPDPFVDFPDDKLYEICEQLDTQSLARFARSSKRIQNVCWDVLDRRQKELTKKIVDELIELSALQPNSDVCSFKKMAEELTPIIYDGLSGYQIESLEIQAILTPIDWFIVHDEWEIKNLTKIGKILTKYGINYE